MSDLTPSINGRGKDGKFVKGYEGGPGNPFINKVNKLRDQLFACVGTEDIREVIENLLEIAKTKNEHTIAAARLILTYTVGKPKDSPTGDEDATIRAKISKMSTAELWAILEENKKERIITIEQDVT